MKKFKGIRMKKLAFSLIAFMLIVCNLYAQDYVVLRDESVYRLNDLKGTLSLEAGDGINIETNDVKKSLTINSTIEQVQSDWEENDQDNPAFIKNKPSVFSDELVIFYETDPTQIDITFKNLYFDISTNVDESFQNILTLPKSSETNFGKLNLFIHQSPNRIIFYDIADLNILLYPLNKEWISTTNESIWKFEFESLPGTSDWNLLAYWNILLPEVPSFPGFSRFYFNGETIITNYNSGEMTQIYRGDTSLTKIKLGTNITSIGEQAFTGCTSLTNLTIPNSVKYIHRIAFRDCINLSQVSIGNGVNYIESIAFYNCTNLKSIIIPPSVVYIGEAAFMSSGITNIVIPDSVTELASGVFNHCYNLEHVTLPNSITKINSETFEDCTNLCHITIPKSVTEIEHSAFFRSGLMEIVIPDNVKILENQAFRNCNLTNIVVGNGITNINSTVFWENKNLLNLTIGNNVSNIEKDAFYGCTKLEQVIFKGKSISTITNMSNYPWSINTNKASIIGTLD